MAKKRPKLMRREGERGSIFSLAVIAVMLFVFLVIFTGVWFRDHYVAYEIVGSSMERTLSDGDWVYGNQRLKAERGDVVIVDVKDRPVFGGDEAIIKRLIAVGGDTVVCRDGVVYVKEQEGDFYAVDDGHAFGPTADFDAVTLAQGEIFVMGDNREGRNSFDSRDRRVGPLRYDKIVAVVPEWSVEWRDSIGAWEMFRKDVRDFFANLFNGGVK